MRRCGSTDTLQGEPPGRVLAAARRIGAPSPRVDEVVGADEVSKSEQK